MSAAVAPEGGALPPLAKDAWKGEKKKPADAASSVEAAEEAPEAGTSSCMDLSDHPEIESHAANAKTQWELDSVVSTVEEPSMYVLMWAMAVGDNRGVPQTDRASRWSAKLLTLLTALIQVLVPILVINTLLFNEEGKIDWKEVCPGWILDDTTSYCDHGFNHQWRSTDKIKTGVSPNHCDDDFLLEADDIFPASIEEYKFKDHDDNKFKDDDDYFQSFISGTMAMDGQQPVHTVKISSLGTQSMKFEHFQKTHVNITLDMAALRNVLLNENEEYWTREIRLTVIEEKITAFILSVYLSSSIVSTIQEAYCFLKLIHVFRKGASFTEHFWLYLGCVVEMISVVLIVVATQLLMIDSPTMTDQLLNCVALNFLQEVDNSVVLLTQFFPGCQSFDVRSKFVLAHIVDNWETSTEKAAYVQDLETMKKEGTFRNVAKVLHRFQMVYWFYICFIIVLSTGGSVCISRSQFHNH